jgi:hypothetical protein
LLTPRDNPGVVRTERRGGEEIPRVVEEDGMIGSSSDGGSGWQGARRAWAAHAVQGGSARQDRTAPPEAVGGSSDGLPCASISRFRRCVSSGSRRDSIVPS